MLPLESSCCHPERGRETKSVRACAVLASITLAAVMACGPAPQSSQQQTEQQTDLLSLKRCGNGVCSGKETCDTCSADCGPCPPVCDDGVCNGDETCSSCPADCGTCSPACGDGLCNGDETCTTCPAECGTCPPACGDGVCNGTESCSSCLQDCGACPPSCGDGACNGTETCSSCSADCGACPAVCGDGTCNGTETCSSCSGDCGECTTTTYCVPNDCCYPTACVVPTQPLTCGGACNADNWQMTCAVTNGQCSVVEACGDHACTGTETCDTCPDDCGACPTTTVSCTASFTYGCSSDICPVCDQITAVMNDTDKTNLQAACGLSGGQFTLGYCDATSAVQGYCYYPAPTTTYLMTMPIAADVDEYYYPEFTSSDAEQACASLGGVWRR